MGEATKRVTTTLTRKAAARAVEEYRERLKALTDDVAEFWVGLEDGPAEGLLDLTCESLVTALDGLKLTARVLARD